MNKRGAWLIGILVLIAVVVAGGYWFSKVREKRADIGNAELVTAPKGKVVSGFPAEFLLEQAAIDESYRIDYENGIVQPVIVYASSKSFADNLTAFRALLDEKGWAVVQEDLSEPEGLLYGVRDDEEVNVTVVTEGDGTVRVTLAYAKSTSEQ